MKQTIPHPENYRDRVFAISEFKIPTTLGGKRRKLTLYEAAVLNLGIKAAEGDLRAAERFLDVVDAQIERELRFMREEQKNLQNVDPAWLSEPDPARRASLKKRWDHAVAAARGRRERTAPPFPPPQRPRRR